MKNTIQIKAMQVLSRTYNALCNPTVALTLTLVILQCGTALAQADELGTMTTQLNQRLTSLYRLMSVLVIAALIYFGGKNAANAMNGTDDRGWMKFAAVLLVGAIWFFGIPPLITSLTSGARTINTGFN